VGGSLAVLIPARNEAGNIGPVVEAFRRLERERAPLVGEVVVVDNASTDQTARIAVVAGATVIREPRPGYGRACHSGLAHLANRPAGPPAIVAFADGNGTVEAPALLELTAPIEADQADFVLGSRRRRAESGAVSLQQKLGNGLACWMIHRLYGTRYRDLAPFRAIRWTSLQALEMRDLDYGWSIEMQVKACKHGLRIREIDVLTHPRASGKSKVSGTLRGAVGAGWKIVTTVLRYR
jgi:glycosyltransferase involved in cell wall biosynthesis